MKGQVNMTSSSLVTPCFEKKNCEEHHKTKQKQNMKSHKTGCLDQDHDI